MPNFFPQMAKYVFEVYAHGVGSSCGGNDYHHEVFHLVGPDGDVTACGVKLPNVFSKSKHWWRTDAVKVAAFVPLFIVRNSRATDQDINVICLRCAKALQRIEKESNHG